MHSFLNIRKRDVASKSESRSFFFCTAYSIIKHPFASMGSIVSPCNYASFDQQVHWLSRKK